MFAKRPSEFLLIPARADKWRTRVIVKGSSPLPGALGRFALLLSRILFRRRVHKSIETVKTLILFLYEAAIFHFLGWSRNLFGRWRHLLIIAVEAFFALIFNVKTGPQCL
jgi:hypothetical protein